MSEGFYPINNEVLKFDLDKDLEKIRFNHYITQKENLQRIKGDLPRGHFRMTINQVNKDLNVTFAEARGLIKKFTEKNIITNVYTPPKGCKNPSIWKYNSAIFTNNDDSNESNNDNSNEKPSNIKGLTDVTNNDISNDTNNEINNPKKEYIKNKNKKEIYVQQAEQLWSLYPSKTGKGKVINKIPKLIEEEGYEQLKNCIERYVSHVKNERNGGFKDLKYQNGSTFFNNGYVDYLDKNYKEVINSNIKIQEKEKPKKLLGWE